jgi:hypothetical protein
MNDIPFSLNNKAFLKKGIRKDTPSMEVRGRLYIVTL